MPLRGRSSKPPYEVMGGRGARLQKSETSEAPHESLSVGPDGRTGDPHEPSGERWLSGGGGPGEPLLLRLPRGVAVMAAVGFFCLLLLAYWVGLVQGSRGAGDAPMDNVAAAEGGVKPAPGGPIPGNDSTSAAIETPPGVPAPRVVPPSELPKEDSRKAGLNYFNLALYDRPQAERLVDFLSDNGVDAIVSPGDNKLFAVIDLRGFTADELGGAAFRDYRNKLRRLGQVWKGKYNGPSDLSDMWPSKYK